MKAVSQIVGVVGILVVVVAVFGRFHGAQTIGLGGHHFAAASVLLMGNTILLIGLFLGLVNGKGNKPSA